MSRILQAMLSMTGRVTMLGLSRWAGKGGSSQVLLREFRQYHPESSILDLKAYFRAAKYFQEIIKMLPHKPEPILLQQIFGQVGSLGCIHPVNVHVSSP